MNAGAKAAVPRTRTGGCDGCRARAEVDVYLPGGRLLELCGPHGRRHQSALRAQGALVVGRFRDAWQRLAGRPSNR
jgi:hypothetical protein